jgi:hypothetical protein
MYCKKQHGIFLAADFLEEFDVTDHKLQVQQMVTENGLFSHLYTLHSLIKTTRYIIPSTKNPRNKNTGYFDQHIRLSHYLIMNKNVMTSIHMA